jgi:hypothetical protein
MMYRHIVVQNHTRRPRLLLQLFRDHEELTKLVSGMLIGLYDTVTAPPPGSGDDVSLFVELLSMCPSIVSLGLIYLNDVGPEMDFWRAMSNLPLKGLFLFLYKSFSPAVVKMMNDLPSLEHFDIHSMDEPFTVDMPRLRRLELTDLEMQLANSIVSGCAQLEAVHARYDFNLLRLAEVQDFLESISRLQFLRILAFWYGGMPPTQDYSLELSNLIHKIVGKKSKLESLGLSNTLIKGTIPKFEKIRSFSLELGKGSSIGWLLDALDSDRESEHFSLLKILQVVPISVISDLVKWNVDRQKLISLCQKRSIFLIEDANPLWEWGEPVPDWFGRKFWMS